MELEDLEVEDLEVGDYVRTVRKGIKRIEIIHENRPINRYGYAIDWEFDGITYDIIRTMEVIKHSKNLIDLIEIGDYVNEKPIIVVQKNINGTELIDCNGIRILADNIESVVTKEQFKMMKYKVEKQE